MDEIKNNGMPSFETIALAYPLACQWPVILEAVTLNGATRYQISTIAGDDMYRVDSAGETEEAGYVAYMRYLDMEPIEWAHEVDRAIMRAVTRL